MVSNAIPLRPAAGLPHHVAIIMDGNGRWARQRGLPRHFGHRAGVEAVERIAEAAIACGVEVLTLFAFSSENWRRPRREVNLLLELLASSLQKQTARLHQQAIRVRFIGAREAFPERLRDILHQAEQLTLANTKMQLVLALDYGGRWDILQAARHLAATAQREGLAPELLSEMQLTAGLAFPDLPDPDLFIRTGGEQRISNFLLWQLAYTELYFTNKFWPEFDRAAFELALAEYARRQRRFGRTSEQLSRDRVR
jgi:undecaprenyl diphosphate synthase